MHYDWLAILAFVSITSVLLVYLVLIVKPGWRGNQLPRQSLLSMATGIALMWPRTAYVVFIGRTNNVLLNFLELLMLIGSIILVWASSRQLKDWRKSRASDAKEP